MWRILVCGGRDFADERWMEEALAPWVIPGQTILIHGNARGADKLSEKVFKQKFKVLLNDMEQFIERYPADWVKYPKAAGPIRNQQMLDEGRPDLVLAFPGGKGTRDMIKRAKKARVRVIEL